jgi:hypothetical protein
MSEKHPDNTRTGEREFTIHIDRAAFRVDSASMTGSQLRNLPTPPIGPEFDLWLDAEEGPDILVADTQVIALKDGMHFFTAPAIINPGSD